MGLLVWIYKASFQRRRVEFLACPRMFESVQIPTLLCWKEAIYIHTNKPINQPSLLLNHTILRATNLLASRLPLQPPDNNPSDATHGLPRLPVDGLSHNTCP